LESQQSHKVTAHKYLNKPQTLPPSSPALLDGGSFWPWIMCCCLSHHTNSTNCPDEDKKRQRLIQDLSLLLKTSSEIQRFLFPEAEREFYITSFWPCVCKKTALVSWLDYHGLQVTPWFRMPLHVQFICPFCETISC